MSVMVSLLVVVSIVLVAVLPTLAVAPDPGLRFSDLEYLGCYVDGGWHNRAFRQVYANVRHQIDWTRWRNLSYIVEICATKLIERPGSGHSVFAVQDWGECRADTDADRFKRFNNDPSKCYSDVGGPMANAVYRIKEHVKCNVYDPLYINGRTRYFPLGPRECKACTCNGGRTNCDKLICDYAFPCEKYKPVSKNSCCSKCACHHLGIDKLNGEEWADRRQQGICRQCQCINGEASCEKTTCSANCHNPEYIPGRCCPRCRPKAPTTSPWEIITFPTTEAHPTFPMPPQLKLPGFGKKSLRKKRSKNAKISRVIPLGIVSLFLGSP